MHRPALFLHLAAAIFWMGGMAFTVLAMRPAMAEQPAPTQRLPDAGVPPGWHAMPGIADSISDNPA